MIKVENLNYTYPKATEQTLKNLNFEIRQGEIFGFLGPSGSGKSTTQKILYKILNQYTGSIFINGKPLKDHGKEYFEGIGVGFELPNHYMKLTAKENLELFASFYKCKNEIDIPALFEMVGLSDSINKEVSAYSKGMKMRLNFIRAIMNKPDILFFDEPTAGLDPVNAHKIKQLIHQLRKDGTTIFITTHNMNTADELCDDVAFIVDGSIKMIDKPSRLKQKYGKKEVEVRMDNGKIKNFPTHKIGQNHSFLDFIQSGDVQKIKTMEASLEEVFIQVTGKALLV